MSFSRERRLIDGARVFDTEGAGHAARLAGEEADCTEDLIEGDGTAGAVRLISSAADFVGMLFFWRRLP